MGKLIYKAKQFREDIKKHAEDKNWLISYDEIMKYSWYWWQKSWISDNKLIPCLINEMLKAVGETEYDYEKISETPWINNIEWYMNWMWTKEEAEKFKKEKIIPLIKKVLPHYKTETEASWFMLQWGFAYREDDFDEKNIDERREGNKKKALEDCERFGITFDEWTNLKIDSLKNDSHALYPILFERKYGIDKDESFLICWEEKCSTRDITDEMITEWKKCKEKLNVDTNVIRDIYEKSGRNITYHNITKEDVEKYLKDKEEEEKKWREDIRKNWHYELEKSGKIKKVYEEEQE